MPRARKNPDYQPPVTPENRVVDVSDIPEDRAESPELAIAIEKANGLIEQRKAVQEQLHQCRMLGHLLADTGSGSREQIEWLRKYLPRKQKKNGDDTTEEATS